MRRQLVEVLSSLTRDAVRPAPGTVDRLRPARTHQARRLKGSQDAVRPTRLNDDTAATQLADQTPTMTLAELAQCEQQPCRQEDLIWRFRAWRSAGPCRHGYMCLTHILRACVLSPPNRSLITDSCRPATNLVVQVMIDAETGEPRAGQSTTGGRSKPPGSVACAVLRGPRPRGAPPLRARTTPSPRRTRCPGRRPQSRPD